MENDTKIIIDWTVPQKKIKTHFYFFLDNRNNYEDYAKQHKVACTYIKIPLTRTKSYIIFSDLL